MYIGPCRYVPLACADESEAGVMPSTELLAKMGAYNEQLVQAGVMLAGDGLHLAWHNHDFEFSRLAGGACPADPVGDLGARHPDECEMCPSTANSPPWRAPTGGFCRGCYSLKSGICNR